MIKENKAINPNPQESYEAVMMRTRSEAIKIVHVRDAESGIGGATNVSKGEVFVPSEQTAFGRLVRYHEALHAEHSPAQTAKPRDILDQSLEDARLHRYKSKATALPYTQARRDELTVALQDLRFLKHKNLNAVSSLTALRAYAILTSAPMKKAHQALLSSILARFGKNAEKNMADAVASLKNSNGDNDTPEWKKARKFVAEYFGKEFSSEQQFKMKMKGNRGNGEGEEAKPESKPSQSKQGKNEGQSDSNAQEGQATSKSAEREDQSDSGKSSSGGSETSDEKTSEDGSSEASKSEQETERDDEESSNTGVGEEGEENEDEEEEENEEAEIEIAPAIPEKKAKPVKADAYQENLAPECDKETYDKLSKLRPLTVYVRRLDMGANRVSTILGQRKPAPVAAGRKIIPSRLASSAANPQVRLFERKIQRGNAGTIIIDASGSMHLSDETLQQFLASAPALTLAFYNAPHDSANYGQIFIYAANGFRADSLEHGLRTKYGGWGCTNVGGGGNVIDYQAMAWLIKQPAPHYIVTDRQFTGVWEEAAKELARKLEASKQIVVVENLDEMQKILETKKRKF